MPNIVAHPIWVPIALSRTLVLGRELASTKRTQSVLPGDPPVTPNALVPPLLKDIIVRFFRYRRETLRYVLGAKGIPPTFSSRRGVGSSSTGKANRVQLPAAEL